MACVGKDISDRHQEMGQFVFIKKQSFVGFKLGETYREDGTQKRCVHTENITKITDLYVVNIHEFNYISKRRKTDFSTSYYFLLLKCSKCIPNIYLLQKQHVYTYFTSVFYFLLTVPNFNSFL